MTSQSQTWPLRNCGSYVSQFVTLTPGDVIFTGTPGKTQAVTYGDSNEIEIESVGRLRNSVAVR